MNSVTPCSRASAASPACTCAGTVQRHRVPAVARHRPGAAGRRAAPAPPAPRPARPATSAACRDSRLPGSSAVAQQLPLPDRVVGVLHRQRRPPRRPARAPRGVRRRQVPGQHPRRPAVGGDVVQHQHQHVHAGPTASSRARTGISAARSNGSAAASRHRGGQVRLGHLGDRQLPAQLVHAQDLLVRLPVAGREHGAQHLVPGDHVAQRRLQRRGVQVPVQPQRHRDVVDAPRALELGDEPQPLLGERQRHPLRPRPGRQRQPRRARLLPAARPARPGSVPRTPPGPAARRPAPPGSGWPAGPPAASGRRGRRSHHRGRPGPGPARRRTPRTAAPPPRWRDPGPPRPSRGRERAARPGPACRWRSAAAPSSTTTADGTMCSGSRAAACSRAAAGSPPGSLLPSGTT